MPFPTEKDPLSGQRVLIIGGSSGIGLGTALLAAAQGATVTLAGRDPARLDQAIQAVGGDCRGLVLDMTDQAAVERFFQSGEAFDHVVVTAAAIRSGRIGELPVDTARATFDSKFWGPYHVARSAKISSTGSLTLVSGVAARRPRAGRGPIAAACAALEALTRVLASELTPVRVNCVSPGLIDTPMLRAAMSPGGSLAAPNQPVPRVGRPEEVAFQILACAINPYMTGAVVDVDGGYSAA